MKRNEFIKTCGSICLSTSAITLLLQSCGSIHYASHTLEENIIKLNRSEFVELKNEQTSQRSFVIVKDEGLPFPIVVYKNGDQAIALLMQCTHQGCEVNPNAYSLVCPCHGSEFDTTGKVINPPAEEPLKNYKVTMDDHYYYIHLS
ncbi:MAG: Rieske (2Fe-2S) protein [Cyclobacteriaceae bacterium]|nr:Rieske (2Fe-2S) protein [Cyclobacteriaceae bacterium]